ncbi:MAG: plastocyanin/azurin family copper-binding protein [Halanaeroarchaeum sp.]
MRRRQYLKTVGSVAGAGALAGCSSGGSQDSGSNGEDGGGDPNTVDMVTDGASYYFDPIGLFVEPGTTVTFRIESGSHTATAYVDGLGGAATTRIPDGGVEFDTGLLSQQGATADVTFETEGTYDYFCIPHKTMGMVGRIVVGSPGGPAEGSMPPDGRVPESAAIVDEGRISFAEFSG